MNETQWKPIIERESEPLTIFQIAMGRKFYPEILEIEFRPQRIKYENKTYYFDSKEMIAEYDTIKQKYKEDPNYFDKIIKKAIQMGEELVEISKNVSSNLKEKDNKTLSELFKLYNIALSKYATFAWATHLIEKILTDKINEEIRKLFPDKTEDELKRIFSILTIIKKESSAMKEYKSLLKVAILFKKSKKFTEDELQNIHEKFFWLGAISICWSYSKEPYDINHYKKVVLDLTMGNPNEELNKLIQKKKEKLNEYSEFVKTQQLNEQLIKDVELLSEYLFLRTVRGEYIVHSEVYARKLLQEITNRFKLKFEDILYFLPHEIVKLLLEGEIPDFQSRKEGFNLLIDKERVSLTHAKVMEEEVISKERIIKGNIACKGRAEGFVKIVRDLNDISKIQSGDILVTKMTSPYMILAIHRAVAIVTDEGGISCHAAIISREFGTPCIVGTHNATKVLKDGDLVRVDAEKGIVEKL